MIRLRFRLVRVVLHDKDTASDRVIKGYGMMDFLITIYNFIAGGIFYVLDRRSQKITLYNLLTKEIFSMFVRRSQRGISWNVGR